MLNPKTNICKLRTGVLLSLFACFQDGRQNHTESYIVVDSLFNVPRNICEGSVLVFVLLCIYLCSFYFCWHLDEEENDSCFALIVVWCLVTVSVLFLFLRMPWVDLQ